MIAIAREPSSFVSKIQCRLSNGSFTMEAIIGAMKSGRGFLDITNHCADKNFFSRSMVSRFAASE
jgi:hypothetical protein